MFNNRYDTIENNFSYLKNHHMTPSHLTDPTTKVGYIINGFYNKKTKSYMYDVLCDLDNGIKALITCYPLFPFSGTQNKEYYFLEKTAYKTAANQNEVFRDGEKVVVLMLQPAIEDIGVILGSLSHPNHTPKIGQSDIEYYKIYNGAEEKITNKGDYIFTLYSGLKFISSRITEYNNPKKYISVDINNPKTPSKPIVATEGDPSEGSQMQFTKTGNILLSDRALGVGPQFLAITKTKGTTTLQSGQSSIILDKNKNQLDISNKIYDCKSEDKHSTKTKEYSVEAKNAKIKSDKIAIGKDGVELLDQIIKLIDAMGQLTIITPIGPANLMQAAPQWSQVEQVKSKIKEIKGSL